MTKTELIENWLKRNNFGGTTEWWSNGVKYYTVSAKDILRIHNYLKLK